MSNRIMDFIEKSNKVLLFFAAIFVIIVVGKNVLEDIMRKDYSPPTVQVIKSDDTKAIEQKVKLEKQYVGLINDVHIFEITSDRVVQEQPYSLSAERIVISSSFGLSENAVNLMFTKIGEQRKLLFEKNALIVEFSPSRDKQTQYDKILSKNIYSVAKYDSNNDGFLNDHDKKELLVSEYDGSNLTPVMDDIKGYEVVDNDLVLIYSASDADTLYFIFNIRTGELQKLDTAW
ncbi:hypothetical protein JAO78_011940 [Alishewanella sp. 16-MA]|uniref:Uncharacterized protein n=1 Tax=Alishewanella maricola TaxID=2795740 RepID=A0ABS8C5B4_9ALTE|nr:hypothetical protein [Alishewanella maricola]MCB5227522.1 hypothetical protein [Alishewanella maricola]